MAPPAPPKPPRTKNSPKQRAQLSQLVLECLKYLSENTSWSTKAVTSLIKSVPRAAALATKCGCTKDTLGRRVGATLRSGASFGILKSQGNRYRFGHLQQKRRA